MASRSGNVGIWTVAVLVGLGIVAGGVAVVMREFRAAKQVVAPTTAPATQPTTMPATAPTAPAKKPVDYMDVVRANYPDFPTTQPLVVPVALGEAARLVISDPIYLDNQGELWITRDDAESTVNVLKDAHKRSTHVLRDRVVYVHRWPDETGVWQPHLICRKEGGGYEIVTRLARQDIPGSYNYEWHRAFAWNEAIVVPTDRGVSIVRPDRRPMELHHDFFAAEQFDAEKRTAVQALLDWRGLLAWMPTENGKLGSKGAARFVNEQWKVLDASTGWPELIVHLVPLLDGSVLQLLVGEDGNVELKIATLDPPQVDEKRITDLVGQLSDPVAVKRVAAFNELARWGPGAWPLLEKLLTDQPPEAQIRIQQLLGERAQPTLGGMKLEAGPIKVVARSAFGAAVLHSQAGVSILRDGDEEPLVVNPAWISIQPGRSIELASGALAAELEVKGRQLRIVRGEWIVEDDAEGPRWWLSNHLTSPLLKGKELEFRHLLGMDHRGRWLFRKSPTDDSPTLVLDPSLPDPSPRMPVWVYPLVDGKVGWTQENWPAIKRGGAWALVNTDWKPLEEGKDKFLTVEDPLPTTSPVIVAPTTDQALGTAILSEPDGTRFFDGRETLVMVKPDGQRLTWPLPPEGTGNGDVQLFRAGENRLFLFNAPGRVLRLKPTLGDSEPFVLEATITKNIPNVDHPDRIWLDPAGRIVIAYDGSALAICFPNGQIPPEIAKKMIAKDLEQADQ